jgi:hypothetical protein
MMGGKKVGGIRLRVLEPVKTAKASKPIAPKPVPANEWPEEAGDPASNPIRTPARTSIRLLNNARTTLLRLTPQ